MKPSVVIVDALAHGSKGRRLATVDAIGAGPRTVAGVLEAYGITVDLYVAEKVIEKPSVLRGYDVLFVSGMSVDEATVARVVRIWRRSNDGLVVVGGPIASDPEFLVRVDGDIGVYGEAEQAVDRLVGEGVLENSNVDTGKLRGLCGIVYKDGNRVIVNRRCPIMTRRMWERYRPSTRVVTGYPLYWAARVYVEVVRGCSNYTIPRLEDILPPDLLPDKPKPGCAYCSVISLYGYARSRSIDLVVSEVKELISLGVSRIVLSGPDFLDYGRDWLVEPQPLLNPRYPPANIEALRRLLSELANIPEISSGEAAVMAENVKPSLVTEEVGEVLGEYLRDTPVHVGAETGSDRLLRMLGRPATTHETIRAVRILRRHGLRPYVYIMYCLPGEDSEVIELTLRYMEKLYNAGAEKITAYKFTPLPLSYLEKMAFKRVEVKCPSPHPIRVKAEEINRRAKKKLIGTKMKVIIVGRHPKYRRPLGYPLPHGPVTLLDRGKPGEVVLARVTSVIGDRMVEAVKLKTIAYKNVYSE